MRDQVEILLEEDDPEDLELTMRALTDGRICNSIQVARDGEEALDFLFCRGKHIARDPERRPKLVLLDLNLPKVDGLAVLKEIVWRNTSTNIWVDFKVFGVVPLTFIFGALQVPLLKKYEIEQPAE